MTSHAGEQSRAGRLSRSARRAQLLDSALDVFVAQGYHAAAMHDIAVRAGVSKPVLYQHFPGKLDLYLALLDAACDQVVAEVREALASTTDNKARVAATTEAFYSYVADGGGAFRLVFESDLRNDPEVRDAVDRGARQCIEAIAEVIAVETGADPERSLLLSAGMTGLAETSARWWLATDGTVSRDEAVSQMSALAWRGMSGFPRRDDEGAAAG